MKHIAWIVAALVYPPPALVTSPPRPVTTGPIIDERVEYYEVSGTSARELRLEFRRLGPKGVQGHAPWVTAVAVTSWTVAWEADYWSGEGTCALKSFRTRVKIRIVMPRWRGRVAGSPLTERWDEFLEAVTAHEQGHAEHGIQAAKEIEERVSALAPAGTCKELESSIQSVWRTSDAKYRQEDVDYDWRRSGDAVFDDDETLWLLSRGSIPRGRTPPAVPDAEMTDTDRMRQEGTARFEADMAELSVRADEGDVAWRVYSKRCQPQFIDVSAAGAVGPRSWFAYAFQRDIAARVTEACTEGRSFYALVDPIKDGMCGAEERARRSSVYPGTRRELRARYRLEWEGWDRVCPSP